MRRAFAFAILEQHLGLLLSLVLLLGVSRLLTPQEIGVAAIGTCIATVAFTLRDFASSEFLIQRSEIHDADIRTAQTIQFVLAAVIAGGILVAAPWLGRAYAAEGLTRFLAVMCVAGLLESIISPAQALLRREMAFGTLAQISTGGIAAAAVTTLALAALGYGYISLAWGQAVAAVVKTVLTFRSQVALPSYRPSLATWRAAFGFGGYYAGMSMITKAYEAMPQLLLGWVMQPSAVGFYNRATLVAAMPGRLLLSPVDSLAFAALAARARGAQDHREVYLRGLSYMSVVYCPALAMLAILADPAVTVALGSGWDEVVPLVRILAIGSITFFPAILTGPLLIVSGKIRRAFLNSIASRGIGALIIAASSFHGLIALAIGQALALQVCGLMAVGAARRHLGFAWRDLAGALLPSASVSLFTVAGPLAFIATRDLSFSLGVIETLACLLLAAGGWLLGLSVTRHPFRTELRVVLDSVTSAAGRLASATIR